MILCQKDWFFFLWDRPPSVQNCPNCTEGGLSISNKISLFGIKSIWLKISPWNFYQFYVYSRVGNFHLEVQVPWYYCLEPRVTSTQRLEEFSDCGSGRVQSQVLAVNFFRVNFLIVWKVRVVSGQGIEDISIFKSGQVN